MADFAIPTVHKLARFYLLPKVHKAGVPGRPVVSCSGSLTEQISEILYFFLKPYLPAVTSYLKDAKDFLSNVRAIDQLPLDTLLVSLDVVSLYPSIPHDDGLSALSAFLGQQGLPHTVRQDLCALAKFVLTKNTFEFNSQVYLQVAGTAIGTRMDPTYAIIFMHMLETNILASATYKPLSWLRFIDDVWSAWTHGKEKLISFIQHLRATLPSNSPGKPRIPLYISWMSTHI
jgi:hypothetical protein